MTQVCNSAIVVVHHTDMPVRRRPAADFSSARVYAGQRVDPSVSFPSLASNITVFIISTFIMRSEVIRLKLCPGIQVVPGSI